MSVFPSLTARARIALLCVSQVEGDHEVLLPFSILHFFSQPFELFCLLFKGLAIITQHYPRATEKVIVRDASKTRLVHVLTPSHG
jgi:hypothetical protein